MLDVMELGGEPTTTRESAPSKHRRRIRGGQCLRDAIAGLIGGFSVGVIVIFIIDAGIPAFATMIIFRAVYVALFACLGGFIGLVAGACCSGCCRARLAERLHLRFRRTPMTRPLPTWCCCWCCALPLFTIAALLIAIPSDVSINLRLGIMLLVGPIAGPPLPPNYCADSLAVSATQRAALEAGEAPWWRAYGADATSAARSLVSLMTREEQLRLVEGVGFGFGAPQDGFFCAPPSCWSLETLWTSACRPLCCQACRQPCHCNRPLRSHQQTAI